MLKHDMMHLGRTAETTIIASTITTELVGIPSRWDFPSGRHHHYLGMRDHLQTGANALLTSNSLGRARCKCGSTPAPGSPARYTLQRSFPTSSSSCSPWSASPMRPSEQASESTEVPSMRECLFAQQRVRSVLALDPLKHLEPSGYRPAQTLHRRTGGGSRRTFWIHSDVYCNGTAVCVHRRHRRSVTFDVTTTTPGDEWPSASAECRRKAKTAGGTTRYTFRTSGSILLIEKIVSQESL